MLDYHFSQYASSSVLPSPVNIMMSEMASSFRPELDINLGAGYVNERTIPREIIKEALDGVISNPLKYKHPFNYGGSKGTSNLRESILNFYLNKNIGTLSKSDLNELEIVIGTNGATSILEAISEILKKGIVITADPVYYIYGEYLQRKGFDLLTIPEDEQGIQTDLIEEEIEKLGERMKGLSFFYIVTVNNPSTTILSNKRKKEIVAIANRLSNKLGRNIPVFFDKAYEEIIHDKEVEKPISGLKWNELGNVFEIGTLSKILAPAFRIGYILGKKSSLLDVLLQRNNDVGFSASVINQEMASYILDHHINAQLFRVNSEYAEKAREIEVVIHSLLGNEIEKYSGGKAGFYFYLTFKNTRTEPGSPFFNFLSRKTGIEALDGKENKKPLVVYLPGSYCVNPKGKLKEGGRRQLRLSYGFEETEQVLKGIKFMADAIEYASRN